MDNILDWLQGDGSNLVFALVIVIGFYVFGARIISKLIQKMVQEDTLKNKELTEDEKRRADTLSRLTILVARIAVIVFAAMAVLNSFGVNIAPLLAGAGIFGLAIGFGAQDMVKNLIAGFFIISENQYRIGDSVTVAGISGKVRNITLRSTVIKDLDGDIHYVPNGDISVATNKTFEDSKINMNIGVGYDTDIDKLEEIIDKMGEELAGEEKWQNIFITAPKFLRIQEFGDSAIVIKIVGRVDKFHQWEAEGELRRRVKKLFEQHKIDIPYPQRVVHKK